MLQVNEQCSLSSFIQMLLLASLEIRHAQSLIKRLQAIWFGRITGSAGRNGKLALQLGACTMSLPL